MRKNRNTDNNRDTGGKQDRVKNRHTGKVYLVGAGPGDEGLLTVRGAELLKEAEVLLYDRLVNPALLLELPDSCEKILVGKREGNHTMIQEEINRLLIAKAGEGKSVLRLKGGDPFVFGRGGEEILALEEEGIPYEVVPGVTSAVAVLESAGIPVTHRKEARSFHVITGHTAQEGLPEQFEQYAALDGTLIFLMGISHLKEIAEQLLRYGKAPDTPASIVESGTTIRERRIDGTLGNILKIAEENQVKPPAILVVGKTASYHMRSKGLPLAGKKIGVTGTGHMVRKLTPLLEKQGAKVFAAPYLRIVPTEVLKNQMPDWDQIHWIVFTSANGVEQFFFQLQELKMDRRILHRVKYAVIGDGTKERLWDFGFHADYVPKVYTVKALAEGLADLVTKKERICVLRAQEGSEDLRKIWDARGISYEDLGIYKSEVDSSILEMLGQELGELDYLTFASASGVRAYLELKDKCSGNTYDKDLNFHGRMVCIGNKTAELLEESSIQESADSQMVLLAKIQTAEGIVDRILECEQEE